MGVIKSITLYRTDRGEVVAVQDMEVTHLLNAIHHHNVQVETCGFVLETIELTKAGKERLEERREALMTTIMVLSCELVSRDPQNDEVAIEYEGGAY